MHQAHKMVKYTQTICRLLPVNCLSVFVHFVVLAFIVFNIKWIKWHKILRSLLKTLTRHLPLGWNTYLLFNFDIVNLVW